MKSFLLATLASSACLLASLATAQPVYRLKAVQSPTGQQIRATSINNRGHIAGIFEGATGESHIFLYRNGTLSDLGVVAGDVLSVSVNDLDEIVGTGTLPFLWRHGTFKDLTSLGVATVQDINNRGQFVGRTTDGYAYRYSHGEVERFGMPGDWSEAYAINDLGQVVGAMNRPDDNAPHAFLNDHGTLQEIGPPYDSYATTINERGHVSLTYFDDFLGSVAIYRKGVTSPRIWSTADGTSINNAGDLLGQFYRTFPGDPGGAVLLYKDGVAYFLQPLIDPAELPKSELFLSEAGDINDRGQIVANGILGVSASRFFILTPVSQTAASQANN